MRLLLLLLLACTLAVSAGIVRAQAPPGEPIRPAVRLQALTAEALPNTPGAEAQSGFGRDLNDRGVVVGLVAPLAVRWINRAPGTLPGLPGGRGSVAEAVNNRGQIAGSASPRIGNLSRAILWQNGALRQLGFDGEAKDINERGQIAGTRFTVASTGHVLRQAVLWQPGAPNSSNGSVVSLGGPPGFVTVATAINRRGQIVGFATDQQGSSGTHAFLWSPTSANGTTGEMVLLPTPDRPAQALDINDAGEIVGWQARNGRARAFAWKPKRRNGTNGTLTDLHPEGSDSSMATGIDRRGLVIGTHNGSGQSRVFVARRGFSIDLGALGGAGADAAAINNRHEFTGLLLKNDRLRAYVAKLRGIAGRIEYEKVPLTDEGLRVGQRFPVPAAGVPVELRRQGSNHLLASDETDDDGEFFLVPPPGTAGTVYLRVLARSQNVTVVRAEDPDKTHDFRTPNFALGANQFLTKNLRIPDSGRKSGPFNIVGTLRRVNERLEQLLGGGLELPEIQVLWSTATGRNGPLPGTRDSFRLAGRRGRNSDEFDDHVIAGMYGRELLANFSRDDNPYDVNVAPTARADFDPRLAWSEGWGRFFACALLARTDHPSHPGNAIYRNSFENGTLRVNLEDNLLGNDPARTSNAHDAASILWDVFDIPAGGGDTLSVPFLDLWLLVAGPLKTKVYVDVMDFLDVLVAAGSASPADVEALLAARDHDPEEDRVPHDLPSNAPVTGEADSLARRTEVEYHARRYYGFTLAEPAEVILRLEILGPLDAEQPPGSTNLDLVLRDGQDRIVTFSNRLGPRATETIARGLNAGRYVVVVDSVQGTTRFNAASYRLTLTTPGESAEGLALTRRSEGVRRSSRTPAFISRHPVAVR